MDPTVSGIKHSNLQIEKQFLGTTTSWITAVFYDLLFCKVIFCTPVNNFSNMSFKVLSVIRLEALSYELSLLKVNRSVYIA